MLVKYKKDDVYETVDLPLMYFPDEEEKLNFLHKIHDLKSLVKQITALKFFPQMLMKDISLEDRVMVLNSIASVLRIGEEVKETDKDEVQTQVDSTSYDLSGNEPGNTDDDGEHTPPYRRAEDH